MKFSEQWLREWVNPDLSSTELCDQLSMAGLEVDAAEPVAPEFSGIVVAEIKHCERHPEADRLQVCQVACAEGQAESDYLTIVCGAPNARTGLKVALAQIGALLPPAKDESKPFKIKKSKLRGVASQGMLCSGRELGLSDEHEGILELTADAPIGLDLREYLTLNDVSIDVDLTPNRGDCLSIAGVSREVSALNRVAVVPFKIEPIAAVSDTKLEIEVMDEARQACPRYFGRVIKGVNTNAPSPLWLTERLRRSGVRSVSLAVDITNYVMLELGQPMHAFDLKQIEQGIIVRMAQAGEALTLLDGTVIKLESDVLVIADHEKPLAMAGIMGGDHSGVDDSTQDLFLESAFFTPEALVGRARRFGLHTDSSHRFERGVDPELARLALERATQLIIDYAGGKPGPCVGAEALEYIPVASKITLRRARIKRLLGIEIPDSEVEAILEHLQMAVTSEAEGWSIIAPTFRFDMEREEDVIEELIRIYGYEKIPLHMPDLAAQPAQVSEQVLSNKAFANVLRARAYCEAQNYSFLDQETEQLLNPERTPIALANPLSEELGVMRSSLLGGLLKTLAYNQKRQQERVRLFELGTCFTLDAVGNKAEKPYLAGAISGTKNALHWNDADGKREVDFYDIKGDVEALLGLTHLSLRFTTTSDQRLHPGQSAAVFLEGSSEPVGVLGALHPSIANKLGIKNTVFLFELELDRVQQARLPKAQAISRYPSIRRDLAFVIDKSVQAADLQQTIKAAVGDFVQQIFLFDVYEGKNIEKGKKSVALGLILQHLSRTLTEEDVVSLLDKVKNSLITTFGAVLRE